MKTVATDQQSVSRLDRGPCNLKVDTFRRADGLQEHFGKTAYQPSSPGAAPEDSMVTSELGQYSLLGRGTREIPQPAPR